MRMDLLILFRWDNDDFNDCDDDYHEGNIWITAMMIMMVIILMIVGTWLKMTNDGDDDDFDDNGW